MLRVISSGPTKTVDLRKASGGPPSLSDTCSGVNCAGRPEGAQGHARSHCPFGVIGLSYRTASLDIRGRASFNGNDATRLLNLLREHGVSEAMVLSTCNRTEIYFAGPDHELVTQLFAQAADTPIDELRPHIYAKHSICAACHLFRVVSGLDSAVLGETEIVAQVKHAWKVAETAGLFGSGLGILLQRSMEVSKRVRSQTDVCRGVISVAGLAVAEARAQFGSLKGRNAVVIGAGQIAERACKELAHQELGSLLILNRTESKADQLTKIYGGNAGNLDALEDAVAQADIVIAAVAAPQPIIEDGVIGRACAQRNSLLLLIDLGVPAGVSLSQDHKGAMVRNIDSLSAACSENLGRRAEAIPAALALIDEELERLLADLSLRTAAPTIKALTVRAEQIRSQNLEWALERLTGLTDKERKVVEDLSNRIIKGLLQAPIQSLKHELAAAEYREIVSKLFRLDEHPAGEPIAS